MAKSNAFTVAQLKSLPKGKHCDGPGLRLYKRPEGGAQWIFRFQLWGRQREMGLGSYRSVSLAEARKQAELARQQVLREVDPIKQRQLNRQQSNSTDGRLDLLALEAYEKHKKSLKHGGSDGKWFSPLRLHVLPRDCCVNGGLRPVLGFLRLSMPRRSPFKHHRFPRDIILCAVRWYLRYPLSYQDVVDLLAERGITIDRSTVYRWVQKFGPELTKRVEKFLRRASVDWQVDETYVRVGGKWRYLWRAVDANGQMVDFRLTARRDAKAAKAFLNKAIERVRLHRPVTIVTDKAQTYRRVIREINHRYDPHFDSIRQIDRKWRNNLTESDHAAMKRLLGYRQSFRSLRSAKATLSGIETIRTIKRGNIHHKQPGVQGEIQFISQLFVDA